MEKTHVHKTIIEDCKKGKAKAKYKLYELYSKAMFNVCYRMMNSREEAEDMLQEAFTLAFQRLDSFRFESGFGAWLKRIVVNTCINALNKKRPEVVYCQDIYAHDNADNDKEEAELTPQRILEALEQVPEGGRLVFSLYLLEGYDHSEIAQILKISESTSKTQYMRAKQRIQTILKNEQIAIG